MPYLRCKDYPYTGQRDDQPRLSLLCLVFGDHSSLLDFLEKFRAVSKDFLNAKQRIKRC